MSKEIRRIFIPSPLNPQLDAKSQDISQKFTDAGFVMAENPKSADLVAVIGGDGSLLQALREHNYPGVPFIGISSGTLGFLQEVETDKIASFIDDLKAGNFETDTLPLLMYKARETTGVAFNEVVVERASAQTAHLSIAVNGVVFDKFIGDGLIVATPQGSSAYALAAGGAFLSDGLQAMQLVPINPHNTVAYRSLHSPLVVDIKAAIEIKNLEPEHRPVRILADGIECDSDHVSSIVISLSKHRAALLRTKDYNYFAMLARKFIK